ncbi:MAG: peptidase P60, partial [Aeromonas sp.]
MSRKLLLSLLTLLLAACSSSPPPASTSGRSAFDGFYQRWYGVPYKMGGESRSGLDCSAFTQLA